MDEKTALRRQLRSLRKSYVAALPEATHALILMRPPAPLSALMPQGECIGLYHAQANEAPTMGYARWLHENGRRVALPWFANRDAPMQFRLWADPWDEDALKPDPFGAQQPPVTAPLCVPSAVIVPLLGFTAKCDRLGQGAGHYDRWLAENPSATAVGLAWDCQLVEALPLEPHDRRLHAVVTPTRFYERPEHA